MRAARRPGESALASRSLNIVPAGDLRLSTTTYTDTTCLPLFEEMGKLGALFPSPIASPKSDKSCPEAGKPVQSALSLSATKNPFLAGKTVVLTVPDQTRPNGKLAEREGFEPFSRREAKSHVYADLIDG